MPDRTTRAPDPRLRRLAAQLTGDDQLLADQAEAALVSWGPEATAALSEALARAPLVSRTRVVTVLRRRGGADSLAALETATLLARHLQQAEAVPFQIALIEALRALGGTRSINALLRLLSVERAQVQRHAVRAVASCGRAAIPRLCDALSSPHAGVREAAAEALGEIGDSSAIEALHTALWDRRGYSRELATRAAVAVGRVAERSPSRQLESVLPTLVLFTESWSSHQLYRTSRWARTKVETALQKVRSSPIPAQAPPHSLRLLPLPSAEGRSEPERE